MSKVLFYQHTNDWAALIYATEKEIKDLTAMKIVWDFYLIRRGMVKFSGSSGMRMNFFVISGNLHFLYLDENRRLRCGELISIESG